MLKSIKSFDKTRIAYDLHGKAKTNTLFFIHGAGGDYGGWSKERKYFHKKGFTTIAMDLRGHGLSERPMLARDYKLKNFAEDVQAIIRKEQLKKPVLIGHCFGGMVLMQYQKMYPNNAKSYILVDKIGRAHV